MDSYCSNSLKEFSGDSAPADRTGALLQSSDQAARQLHCVRCGSSGRDTWDTFWQQWQKIVDFVSAKQTRKSQKHLVESNVICVFVLLVQKRDGLLQTSRVMEELTTYHEWVKKFAIYWASFQVELCVIRCHVFHIQRLDSTVLLSEEGNVLRRKEEHFLLL